MTSRDELQTLRRGLQTLEFLVKNGPTKVATLVTHLEVARGNAYRILTTLLAEGYCRRVPNSHLYLATSKAAMFASSMRPVDLLTNVSMDLVGKLGKSVRWPVALSTPLGCDMMVCLATDHATPLALVKVSPGYLTPMLRTTTGILYLAFLSEERRAALISEEASRGARRNLVTGAELDQLLSFSRKHLFLTLDAKYAEGSLGVPILVDGISVGGLVMRYIKSAVTRRSIEQKFVPVLQDAAERISVAYSCCCKELGVAAIKS